MPDTYHRDQRASLVAMALYPLLLAAVLFFDVLPYLRAMLEATA